MELTEKARRSARGLLALLLCLILTGCPLEPRQEAELPQEGSSFAVHFIDVGQGDSALVLCDGEAMLIDGGESDQSSVIYSYLQKLDIQRLEYLVATHPHSDHIGGLSGAVQYAQVDTALSPVDDWDTKTFRNLKKYLAEQDVSFTIPSAGDAFSLGSAAVTVIGPAAEYEDANNLSLVLRVDYGGTSFLFTGDMEREAEADLLEAGADLSASVLKVGHHGSSTSTSYPFLREVMPQYAVISCGAGNSYGHPHEETMSRLHDAGVTVYRTDLQGTVICTSDGETVSFTTESGAAPAQPAADGEEQRFIGNKNSQKFHSPDCPNLPSEANQVLFSSYQAALDAGYSPCGNCLK